MLRKSKLVPPSFHPYLKKEKEVRNDINYFFKRIQYLLPKFEKLIEEEYLTRPTIVRAIVFANENKYIWPFEFRHFFYKFEKNIDKEFTAFSIKSMKSVIPYKIRIPVKYFSKDFSDFLSNIYVQRRRPKSFYPATINNSYIYVVDWDIFIPTDEVMLILKEIAPTKYKKWKTYFAKKKSEPVVAIKHKIGGPHG